MVRHPAWETLALVEDALLRGRVARGKLVSRDGRRRTQVLLGQHARHQADHVVRGTDLVVVLVRRQQNQGLQQHQRLPLSQQRPQ